MRLKIKQKVKVTVKDVVKGGVTAYYKSVRCFIPGSLLSYRYVEDMNTFVGKELIVLVEDFDIEKKRVVLSRKAIEVAEREEKKGHSLGRTCSWRKTKRNCYQTNEIWCVCRYWRY